MPDPISALEQELEALRKAFEFSFAGIEKRLPLQQRDELARRIRRMPFPKDAVSNFRYQNLLQRLLSYEQYWDRTIKAIENGTYERDIRRADRRDREAGRTVPEPNATGNPEVRQAISDEAERYLSQMLGQQPASATKETPPTEGQGQDFKIPMRGHALRHLHLPQRDLPGSQEAAQPPSTPGTAPATHPLRPTLPSGMPIIRPIQDQAHPDAPHAEPGSNKPKTGAIPVFPPLVKGAPSTAPHTAQAPLPTAATPLPMSSTPRPLHTPGASRPSRPIPLYLQQNQGSTSAEPNLQPGSQPAQPPHPLPHPAAQKHLTPAPFMPLTPPAQNPTPRPQAARTSQQMPQSGPIPSSSTSQRPSHAMPIVSPQWIANQTQQRPSQPMPQVTPQTPAAPQRPSRAMPIVSPQMLAGQTTPRPSQLMPQVTPRPANPVPQRPSHSMPIVSPQWIANQAQQRPSQPMQQMPQATPNPARPSQSMPQRPLSPQPAHPHESDASKATPKPLPQSLPQLPMRGSSKAHQGEP